MFLTKISKVASCPGAVVKYGKLVFMLPELAILSGANMKGVPVKEATVDVRAHVSQYRPV